MSQEQRPPATVFISYSHRDRAALGRLQVHLKPLEREGLVDRWDDTRIKPGALWRDEIKDALATARVAVLLVSADFLASDFIAAEELPPLLEAERARGLVILPVILGPCRYRETPSLARFQTVNDPARPLSTMRDPQREAVWVKLANDIEAALGRAVPPLGPTPPGRNPRLGIETRAVFPWKVGLIAGALLVLLLVGSLAIPFLTTPKERRGRASQPVPPLPAPPVAVLAGYVLDAETREPLPGVTLTIQDWDALDGRTPTSTSDPAGRFRFDDLRPGPDPVQQVRLVARKDGYEPSYTDPLLGTTDQPIKLRPAATVKDTP
jgi:hypothetical protein